MKEITTDIFSRVAAMLENTGVVCIFGKRGYGKTTFARAVVRRVKKAKLAIDPLFEFSEIPRFAPTAAARNFLLVVDDCETFFRNAGADALADTLAARGRHIGVSIITTSRRPAEVSRLLTSQANAIVCFNTTERRDVEYLGWLIGDEAAALLPTLPKYRFIVRFS